MKLLKGTSGSVKPLRSAAASAAVCNRKTARCVKTQVASPFRASDATEETKRLKEGDAFAELQALSRANVVKQSVNKPQKVRFLMVCLHPFRCIHSTVPRCCAIVIHNVSSYHSQGLSRVERLHLLEILSEAHLGSPQQAHGIVAASLTLLADRE